MTSQMRFICEVVGSVSGPWSLQGSSPSWTLTRCRFSVSLIFHVENEMVGTQGVGTAALTDLCLCMLPFLWLKEEGIFIFGYWPAGLNVTYSVLVLVLKVLHVFRLLFLFSLDLTL